MDFTAALDRKACELGLRLGSTRDPAFRTVGVRRVRRGVFCTDPRRNASLQESVVAALMVLPAGTLAAGLTAARLWRVEALVPVEASEPLEFLVPGRSGSIRQGGSVLHFAAFTGCDLPEGVPATSLPRTLMDLVARGGLTDGLVLVEAALRRDPSLSAELWCELARRPIHRGRGTVERVLALASDLSESVLESRARALWLDAGLPPAQQQAVIRRDGRFVARVDFLWDAARLIVEVDGLAKYAEPGALREEKRRQNELIALGYTVLRFTWADVTGRPEDVLRQVRAALWRVS